jgi:hypothetical protein
MLEQWDLENAKKMVLGLLKLDGQKILKESVAIVAPRFVCHVVGSSKTNTTNKKLR